MRLRREALPTHARQGLGAQTKGAQARKRLGLVLSLGGNIQRICVLLAYIN